ncbi:MAG: tetratricopeptide repeat protein, partial [Hyphococcus sp.]
DGGPTVPSSRDLAAVFELEAPASLEWTFELTPQTDHFKNVPSGMHNAFMALFPAWGFEDEVMAAAAAGGAEAVNAWFAEKRAALGFRFQPAWFDMGVAALRLSRGEQGEAALAVIEQLIAHYPESAYVADFAASVHENLGRYDDAVRENERVVALTREQGLHPNSLHLDRIERALARVRESADAQ